MKAPELETALRRIEELEAEVEKLGKLVDRDTLITAILNRRGVEGRLAPMLEEASLCQINALASHRRNGSALRTATLTASRR